MNQPRTPAADALQWIADECDKVKDVLPFRYAQEELNWGRVNGASAYALKARALLYKASPLNNPSNDQSQWEAAAEAALDFIRKMRHRVIRTGFMTSEIPNKTIINVLCQLRT